MILDKYLKDDLLLIVPDNLKRKIVKYISNLDNIYALKIMTLKELRNHLLFEYDEKALLYLINEKKISYKNAKEYLENLYYLFSDSYDNEKIQNLANLKKELLENDLLIKDKFFLPYLNNKNVIFYGFDHLYRYDELLIENLKQHANVEIINESSRNFKHQVYNFETINNEIEFVFNDILNKIDEGISIKNIFLANVNKDYLTTINRIAKFYGIKVNLNNSSVLYDTALGIKFLNNLGNYEQILEEIKDDKIYNAIINVLNKFYWISDYNSIKDILTAEFKAQKIKDDKLDNAINIIDLKDNIIDDESIVYLIGFNDEYIPRMYKDEDFINDNEKFDFLEKTWEKIDIEKKNIVKKIGDIKNLIITYANLNLKGVMKPSVLITENNYEVIKKDYQISSFSNKSNLFNLGILLDDYIKFGLLNENTNTLLASYPENKYLKYDYKYKKINKDLIRNYFKDKISLSYTKMNTYYECEYKFFLQYILRLSSYEPTFEAYLGSLCHYILSKIYEDDFNFDLEKEKFLTENPFELSADNKLFIEKMFIELKNAIINIKKQQEHTLFKDIYCEKDIVVEKYKDINIVFNGIIDKIMRYDNKIAIIDYKTYTPDIDLSLIDKGLKMQLPIYIYLIKKIDPSSKIIGIYLQYITRSIVSKNNKKTIDEIKKDNLKLVGYTINKEDLIREFDDTYESSEFIKSMSLTAKGFNRFAKTLGEKEFDLLYDYAEKKLEECVDGIINGEFKINPKILGTKNLSCEFCSFKSICFVKDDSFNYIEANKDVLGGDADAIMD